MRRRAARQRGAALAWTGGLAWLGGLAVAGLLLAAGPRPARAEYRSYELEVVDVLDCKLNKREKCRSSRIVTAMSPDVYVQSNGGEERIGVVVLATWMCYGDTSSFREVCPMPAPRSPKYKAGDDVQINLRKHISFGWKGKVELAYYADSLRANVYGVRFADRKNVYARYFEKDLQPAGAGPRSEPPR